MSDKVIGDIFKRFILPAGKTALLDRVATALTAKGSNDIASKDNLAKALKRLLVDGKLHLPESAVPDAELPPLLGQATAAIKAALAASGQPHLALLGELSAGAIKFINNSFDRCGGNDISNPPPGPELGNNNGKPVIVFWLEEDENGLPVLPAVAGDPRFARTRLMLAFEHWQGRLNLDITQTDDRSKANLIVTGRTFGAEVDDSVLALTDIGPPRGVQLRMVFDLAETTLTKDQFEATASHELGHALGIHHRDVPEASQLMSPMLSDIVAPQEGDLRAAVAKGWGRLA
jgi:Matrixin